MNTSNKAWNFKNALAYMLLFLGLQLACSIIAYSVAGMFMNEAAVDQFSQEYTTVILAVSEVLTLLVLALICKLQKMKLPQFLGEDAKLSKKMILPMLMAGMAGNIFTTAFMNILPLSQEVMDNYSNSVGTLTSKFILVDILTVAILAPVVEELIFRGLALSRLKKSLPIWAAVALQALIFGIIHGDLLWVIYATTFGAILGYVRIKTGTVKASILLHIAFNASSFFIGIIFYVAPETFATQAGIAAIACAGLIGALSQLNKE